MVCSLPRPLPEPARSLTGLLLTPIELLDLLAQPVTPPHLHRHRACCVLAPNVAQRETAPAVAIAASAIVKWLPERQRLLMTSLPAPDTPPLT